MKSRPSRDIRLDSYMAGQARVDTLRSSDENERAGHVGEAGHDEHLCSTPTASTRPRELSCWGSDGKRVARDGLMNASCASGRALQLQPKLTNEAGTVQTRRHITTTQSTAVAQVVSGLGSVVYGTVGTRTMTSRENPLRGIVFLLLSLMVMWMPYAPSCVAAGDPAPQASVPRKLRGVAWNSRWQVGRAGIQDCQAPLTPQAPGPRPPAPGPRLYTALHWCRQVLAYSVAGRWWQVAGTLPTLVPLRDRRTDLLRLLFLN